MKRDIEDKFLDAYRGGGLLSLCVRAITYKYDLRMIPKRDMDEKINNDCLSAIQAGFDLFGDELCGLSPRNDQSPLYKEIKDNLESLNTKADKERYLCELIVVFSDLSGFLYPDTFYQIKYDDIEQFAPAEERIERRRKLSGKISEILGFIYDTTDIAEKALFTLINAAFDFEYLLSAVCLINHIDIVD
ncbi:hypothetical protein Barb6_02039 [Bacteroidales bacterium Barb6]|nr:hypothetical protein Barb6_02039 [Bacteroidales bacterium Barb6]